APEHPLVSKLASEAHAKDVAAYVTAARAKSDIDRTDLTKEKTGVPLGASAVNPINGDALPIWVADYVIGTYGTGAVMAVPAHDERDHALAKKYALPIVQVIAPKAENDRAAIDVQKVAYTNDDDHAVTFHQRTNVPVADGIATEEARRLVTKWLEEKGKG